MVPECRRRLSRPLPGRHSTRSSCVCELPSGASWLAVSALRFPQIQPTFQDRLSSRSPSDPQPLRGLEVPDPLPAWQIMGQFHPRKHLIDMEVPIGLDVFRMVEQCRVEMRLVRIAPGQVVEWRSACGAKASRVSGAAFILGRFCAGEPPPAVFLSDPCCHRRGRRATAAVAMAMANPVLLSDKLEGACAAEASPSKHRIIMHALSLQAETSFAAA